MPDIRPANGNVSARTNVCATDQVQNDGYGIRDT
jgi:hypothetical protein